jgi:enoyl-CoA hydratase
MSVTYQLKDRVAIITIDRPGRRNAIDFATARALAAAWRRFDSDDAAYVGVLYGAGGHFSSGADLKSFDIEDTDDGPMGFTRTTVGKPTIAAIEGYCVAGGLEMALWCDLRVASTDAVFGCFERRFGVPLIDGGTQRLPRLIGHGLAMELILTGRAVDAGEAHAIGLVNMVTEPSGALDGALEWASRIAEHPQPTLRSDRLSMIEGRGLPLDEGLALEREYGRSVMHVARAGADHFSAGEGRSGSAVRALVGVGPPDTQEELPWNRVAPAARPSVRPFEVDEMEFEEAPPSDIEDDVDTLEPSATMIETDELDELDEASVELDELDESDESDEAGRHEAPSDVVEIEPEELAEEFVAAASKEPDHTESRAAVPWPGRQGNEVDLGIGRRGYFIAPVVERGHAVVVLSDIGDHLADHVLDASDRIASLGNSALAVDLFTDDSGPGDLHPDAVVRLVATAIDTLIAGGFAASGTVGLVGFGVGGSLAMWIAGLEERVTSVAAFGPHSPWAEVGVGWRLSEAAYLCHQSSSTQPPGAPDPAKTEIELRDLGLDATFHTYPVEPVDFYKPGTSGYDARMADVAWQRTELFLERHL